MPAGIPEECTPAPECPPSLPFSTAQFCDLNTGNPVVAVYSLPCDGGAVGVPELVGVYDATTMAPIVGAVLGDCGNSSWDHEMICDTDPVTGDTIAVYSWLLKADQSTVPPTLTWEAVTPGSGAPYTPVGVPRFCTQALPTMVAEEWCVTATNGAQRTVQATKLIPTDGTVPVLTFYDIDPTDGSLSPLELAAGDSLTLGSCQQPVLRSVRICAIVDRLGVPTDEELIAHYSGTDPNTQVYYTDLNGIALAPALVTPTACCGTTKAVEWICEREPATGLSRPLEVVKVIDGAGTVVAQRYFTILGAETALSPTGVLSSGPCDVATYDAERICAVVDRSATGGPVDSNEEVMAHYSGVWPAVVAHYTDLDGTALLDTQVTPTACCASMVLNEWVCWDNAGVPTTLEAIKVVTQNGDLVGIRYYTVEGAEVVAPAPISAGICGCPSFTPLGVITDWADLTN